MTIAAAAPSEFEDLFETLDQMTVVEMVAFIKRVEEKFNVSAQPTAVPAGPVAEVAPAEVVEQTEFAVILTEAGQNRINVIKLVKEVTNLGLAESKGLVDSLPKPVKQELSKADAEALKARFDEAGATVEVK